MRRPLSVALLLLAAASAGAADPPRPHALTATKIADGWLLLFDGETTFGWHIDGEARIADGLLVLGGGRETVARTTTAFGFYDASLVLSPNGQEWGTIVICRDRGYTTVTKRRSTLDERDRVVISEGPGFIQFTVPAGRRLYLSTARVRPRGLEPIFNGKDLTGWKEFPGKKSKFSVTEQGELNVKDGPGDLQTEGKWGDFVLQLDCISHGKHLNSGIFFRCRPGEYQQGYEAQIRNQFTAAPTQEYTLEKYDPQTHHLLGVRKQKYTAVDYGTGAIYRRQPTRKQMSKDGEWFTMTVIARGNHLATWVNGVQVTDWTDNRPPADNARNGCRTAAGPISIQGHDPTTNLSFRNFRIAELPARDR